MSLFADQLQADRLLRLADWADVRFRPAIGRGDDVYELPRPVTQFAVHDTWDSERLKTLLVDGDTIVGSTRNGVDLHMMGEIGTSDGTSPLSATEMFAVLAELRSKLHVGLDDDKFRFYLDYAADSTGRRYFQACTTTRLETDLSNAQVFRYRLVIHADDPTVYETSD